MTAAGQNGLSTADSTSAETLSETPYSASRIAMQIIICFPLMDSASTPASVISFPSVAHWESQRSFFLSFVLRTKRPLYGASRPLGAPARLTAIAAKPPLSSPVCEPRSL